ncbi:Hsp70 family protein [Treponema primitia]|uniref:Hsp70 family protein n=1 Tax=Treponema primitia TaxID=88058 RepID=UPI00025552C8|nr:Hsp70 family protein [Treponema primitia]
MASTIGIKVANGEFYPIMEENSSIKKRLILTTVHDNQKSVQIDLYNSFAKTMADALYVGSLVVENLKPRPKGEPSIEMVLASNAAGEISADAVDLDTSVNGEKQHLSVSLTSMEEDGMDEEIPEFELDSSEHPPRGLYDKASSLHNNGEKKSVPWGLAAVAVVLLLVVCGVVYFFFFNNTGIAIRTGGRSRTAVSVPPEPTPAAKPAPVASAPAVQTPAPSTPAVTPAPAEQTTPPPPASPAPASPAPAVPVISASQQQPKAAAPGAAPRAARTRTPAPVASYKVPQTIPRNGAPYKIRWGDTLWDISEAFYRNPWLYPRIARFNNIRNPDRIISGTTIRIPPRN